MRLKGVIDGNQVNIPEPEGCDGDSKLYMLIGCDGVWETLTAKEILNVADQRIKANPDVKISIIVEELLEKLVAKETIEGLGCDNMSAILITFKH